jgi:hypothetical protein
MIGAVAGVLFHAATEFGEGKQKQIVEASVGFQIICEGFNGAVQFREQAFLLGILVDMCIKAFSTTLAYELTLRIALKCSIEYILSSIERVMFVLTSFISKA